MMPVIPAPGQIWRDPRNPAREVEIELLFPTKVQIRNIKTGRVNTTSRENFTAVVPERNHWVFVRDAPGERAKLG